jgi:hypothetical protein
MKSESIAQPPWASGPGEILQHGLSLLRKDSDVNRRLAMLSIDNAVELMIKTYLGLPRRVTGISLSRKEYNEISESFPHLLDALERYAVEKLHGVDLGAIEWYHRVRNELYHQGNGLTVERDKVEVYAELAKLLFKNLFGSDLHIREGEGTDILGAFMVAWVRLEQVSTGLAGYERETKTGSRPVTPYTLVRALAAEGFIDKVTAEEMKELQKIRNEVIHGIGEHRKILRPEMVQKLNEISRYLEKDIPRILRNQAENEIPRHPKT